MAWCVVLWTNFNAFSFLKGLIFFTHSLGKYSKTSFENDFWVMFFCVIKTIMTKDAASTVERLKLGLVLLCPDLEIFKAPWQRCSPQESSSANKLVSTARHQILLSFFPQTVNCTNLYCNRGHLQQHPFL